MIDIDILANPVVGNLFLLVASIIGVGGSYALYWKRRKDEKRHLRLALKEEIVSMNFEWEDVPGEDVPAMDAYPTTVYDNNAEKIGILSEKEVAQITDFYSNLHVLKSTVESAESIAVHELTDMDVVADAMKGQATELRKSRKETLDLIEEKL